MPALLALLAATLLGAPVFVTLGGAALILFWGADIPIAAVPVEHYRLVTNPSLPTIPLFTLAGYFLAEGGASRRLVRVFQPCSAGSAAARPSSPRWSAPSSPRSPAPPGVTILALGGLLMPVLLQARYSERAALGLLTGAGSLGLLFPPCLPLILYAIVAKVPIEQMFLGGILPGVLLVVVTAWWGMRQMPKSAGARKAFDGPGSRARLLGGQVGAVLPVVALVGLFGGFATPVEAAALTALYAFVVETVIYRDLHSRGTCPGSWPSAACWWAACC